MFEQYGKPEKDKFILQTIKNVTHYFQKRADDELGKHIAAAIYILTHCSDIEITAHKESYMDPYTFVYAATETYTMQPGESADRLDMWITCPDDLAEKYGRP